MRRWFSYKSKKQAEKYLRQKGLFTNNKLTCMIGELRRIRVIENPTVESDFRCFECNCNGNFFNFRYFSPEK
mgnify:CR=1 FL=1